MKIYVALLLVMLTSMSFARQYETPYENTVSISDESSNLENKNKQELLKYAYDITSILVVYFSRIGDIKNMEKMLDIMFFIRDLALQWELRDSFNKESIVINI